MVGVEQAMALNKRVVLVTKDAMVGMGIL